MRDRYLEILIENQPYILMLYEKFADKKPVMLYDIQERRIYAVPYREYRATLSKRSQISLKKQYDRAKADGDIVVFVKDTENEKLVVQLASVIREARCGLTRLSFESCGGSRNGSAPVIRNLRRGEVADTRSGGLPRLSRQGALPIGATDVRKLNPIDSATDAQRA